MLIFCCPPAKEGGERSERVVVLWSSQVIIMRLPKNNHPMPSAFPLLRRRGVKKKNRQICLFLKLVYLSISMNKPGPRERILETASRLFYTQGYNNTGINQILDEAKVAKASLYQHFGCKDELGIHYLKAGREEWFAGIEKWTGAKKTADQKLVACFDFLQYALQQNNFVGCKFINMLSEIGETSPLMYKEITEHKEKLRKYIKSFVESALQRKATEETDVLGDSIYLLFEGAIVESKICKDIWPVKKAKWMVQILLQKV